MKWRATRYHRRRRTAELLREHRECRRWRRRRDQVVFAGVWLLLAAVFALLGAGVTGNAAKPAPPSVRAL